MLFFVFGVFSNSAKIMRTVVLLLLVAIAADEFASSSTSALLRCHALSSHVATSNINDDGGVVLAAHERPLLRRFGRGINKRIRRSEDGRNRSGQDGAYTSHEIIPCLDMRSTMSVSPREREGGGRDDGGWDRALGEGSSSSSAMEGAGGHCYYPASSTRSEIRRAFVESSRGGGGAGRRRDDCNHHDDDEANDGASASASAHGRSSGSGCTIVRLCGSDASSMRDLMNYAHRFFDMVDDDGRNSDVRDAGVFRIDEHVYAGFDDDVNGEGRMQFLDTRMMMMSSSSSSSSSNDDDVDRRTLLPLEVGELVGIESLGHAQRGMEILLEIGTQITSAVLGMDPPAAYKLIDDGTCGTVRESSGHCGEEGRGCESKEFVGDVVSNSYHRLIRYLKPVDASDVGPAFRAHVDSSFLTLIPMPELPGLEVWCPSRDVDETTDDVPPFGGGGEWVRPIIPLGHDGTAADRGDGTRRVPPPCAYVIVLAGEFLQLTSNGQVPVCIHRVVPPRNNAHDAGGTTDDDDCDGDERRDIRRRPMTYKPRVSAPMFLRPRRGMDATLDVGRDLRYVMGGDESTSSSSSSRGGIPLPSPSSGDARRPLYYERGLIDESDGMHLWSAHDIMKRK